MGELILGLYKYKIDFKYHLGNLTVGTEWDNGKKYNIVRFKNLKWHVDHYYKGYLASELFETTKDVLQFFIDNEMNQN